MHCKVLLNSLIFIINDTGISTMTRLLLILFLTISFTTSYAEKQQSKGSESEIIKHIKHLDVFLINTVKNIHKTEKQAAEFKVLNFGIHRCILEGQVWQENTKAFQALLVETQHLNCGKKKYPAPFYSRIILDDRLSLNSQSKFGSFAETGLEVFLVKTK